MRWLQRTGQFGAQGASFYRGIVRADRMMEQVG